MSQRAGEREKQRQREREGGREGGREGAFQPLHPDDKSQGQEVSEDPGALDIVAA